MFSDSYDMMLLSSEKEAEKLIFYVIEGQRQGVSLADKILLADKNSLPLRSGWRYYSKVVKPRDNFNK